MRKKAVLFFILFVTVLFAFACAYSPFNKMQEADFLSHKKYEDRDIEHLYAAKANNLDGLLASLARFPPFLGTLFVFPPNYFSPDTRLVSIFSVLRC
jgi:hypothetical protein